MLDYYSISSVTVDYGNGWQENLRGRLGVRWSIAISTTSFTEVGVGRGTSIFVTDLALLEHIDLTNGQYQDY
jgi:hypothetical protein